MSDRPTVAVDLRALVSSPTGIGFYTLSLLRELAERQEARFVGLSHRPPTHGERLEAAGVELEQQRAPLGVIWQQLRLPGRLARGDIQLFWSPLMTLPLRCPVPAIVTVHDLTPLLIPRAHRLKVRLSLLPFLRGSLDLARFVVADSESTAADLRQRFPACADRLRVIYPGVDPEFRPADAEQVDLIRRELGLPGGYLLFAGTLEPRKNVSTLLAAWSSLRRASAAVPPLVLAGPYGWASRGVMGKVDELRARGLRHLGSVPRDRLVRLMQAATLFVYPSLYEGFGLPAAEAMACGVPTITSDRSSLPEVVGDAGLTCDPEDPTALAEAIQHLLSNPEMARRLGERGCARVQRFSWASAAGAMETLIGEALR